MALAPSPARNARTAATSAVDTSRPSGCWAAKAPAVGQAVEPGALVQDRGLGRARADRVRRDAGAAEFGGQRADEPGHPGLRGAVGGQHRQAPGGRGRGDSQEAPAARLRAAQQGRHRHPGQVQHAAEVDVEHRLLLPGRDLPGGHPAGDDARGRDRRVESAPALLGPPHRGGQGFRVPDVRLDRDAPARRRPPPGPAPPACPARTAAPGRRRTGRPRPPASRPRPARPPWPRRCPAPRP